MQMAGMNGVYGGGGGAMAMMEEGDDSVKRGVKRQASDSQLTDLDRFEKRLRALSIRNDEKRAEKDSQPQFHKRVPSKKGILSTGFKRPPTVPPTSPTNDGMEVDDTRDRVYIADLDAELADVSSDEERLIFLPDIDKKLSRLPQQMYEPSQRTREGQDRQELVLYADPKSLTVDEGHDSVRKAVVEARQRAREKAAEGEKRRQENMERMYDTDLNGMAGHTDAVETAHGYGDAGYVSPLRLDQEDDPDAMDLG